MRRTPLIKTRKAVCPQRSTFQSRGWIIYVCPAHSLCIHNNAQRTESVFLPQSWVVSFFLRHSPAHSKYSNYRLHTIKAVELATQVARLSAYTKKRHGAVRMCLYLTLAGLNDKYMRKFLSHHIVARNSKWAANQSVLEPWL